jgi:PAS domain S-box-containing protein
MQTRDGPDTLKNSNSADSSLPKTSQILLFGLVYFAGATIGQWPTLAPGLTATLWAPSGLTLAILLLVDRSDWWKFASVAFLVDFAVEAAIYDFSLPASAVVALGNVLEALAGAALVRWWCGMPFRFMGIREVLAIAVLAAIPTTMISATLGAATLSATGVQGFGPAWLLWWIGDAVGVLIVAPLTFAAVEQSRTLTRIEMSRVAEFAVLAAGLVFTSHLFFTDRFPFSFIILPFVVWSGVRFGMRGAAVSMAILAAMTFTYVSSGFEPFANGDLSAYERTVVVQAFLGVIAVSAQLLAALTEQRDTALAALRSAQETLEERVREKAAKLRASEEFRELALESAQAAEWSWDIVQNSLGWSERFRSLYGFTSDDAATFAMWLGRVHSDDRDRFQRRIERMLSTPGDDIWSEEFRIQHPERGLVWLGGSGLLKRDSNGAAIRMAGISIDVTQRRAAEFQLRLQQSAQSQLARLGALGQLSAGIAHEITQPLMAAGTYARLAADALAKEQPDHALGARAIKHVVGQIERASEVVRRLRDLIQLGRRSVAPVAFSELAEQTIDLMRPELERAAVSIQNRVPEDLPPIRVDALQVGQVLINLLRNAIDAIAGSGADNRTIRMELVEATPSHAHFSVRDSGPGFPLDQVGQPPQHFKTTKADGLGMGLSLSASIVTAHGGELWIGPNAPGGVLHFTLPFAEEVT